MIIGSIVMFAGMIPPNGWLICDGSPVSRETFSSLFNVIGTSYGEGDGESTFNIPDLKGRVIIGTSDNHSLASIGGEENHGLILNELSEHSHSVPQHGHGNSFTASTPILSHSITQATFTYAGQGNTQATDKTTSTKRHFSGVTSTNATRSTNVSVSNHPSTDCTMSGSVNECQSFDTDDVGIGDQHSNMQPFITLNYMIYTGV